MKRPVDTPLASPAPAQTGADAPLERRLALLLASVVNQDDVPPEADFFDDLGADSLVMAQFCARVRKQPDLPPVSMKDIYRHPNVSALATALQAPTHQGPSREPPPVLTPSPGTPGPGTPGLADARTWEYVTCGVLQVLVYVGYSVTAGVLAVGGYHWLFPDTGAGIGHAAGTGLSVAEVYLRSASFGAATFAVLSFLPVAAKWILIGRWKPQEIRIWSLAYFRFWLVKTLVRTSPLAWMSGSPLLVLYLRALGARVGRQVTVLTHHLPVCTDLLTIGEGTIIRKDVFANGYRAHGGVIQTGGISLGRDVFVGEGSLLEIGTSMGDGSQLGHRSSLHTGQDVPAGERWHGCPARPADVDYRTLEPLPDRPWRRFAFAASELLWLLGVWVPLGLGGVTMLLSRPGATALSGSFTRAFGGGAIVLDALALAAVTLIGGYVLGLTVMTTVPRLLGLVLRPDETYPLYGARYSIHRTIARLTNNRLMLHLVGDSSYVVHYLRALGYDLGRVEQTGSNFGTAVKHESPFLATVGTGTMVADGLSIANADYSATSFRLSRATIGAHNFLGNQIVYPSGARTGDNCLLATKVLVPIDGPVRQDTGLLGSPAFEIPRSVERDTRQQTLTGPELADRLAAKDRHNRHTMGLLLLTRWLILALQMLVLLAGMELSEHHGAWSLALSFLTVFLIAFLAPMLVERALRKTPTRTPGVCSIYDRHFWSHERYWKLQVQDWQLTLLNGTPFRHLAWRMLGVRIGSRVFDDGCRITERALVTVGSRCTLNAGSVIQSHSQEDGAFKCAPNVIGDDCTVGAGVLIHYGGTVEDGVVIAADSFVMKGETLTRGSVWAGNPAHEHHATTTSPATPGRTLS